VDDGLRIIDITNPANPIEIGFFDTGTPGYFGTRVFAEAVAVRGNYAYVTDFWYRTYIVDITDPVNPTEVSFIDFSNHPHKIVLSGNYAYISTDGIEPGLHIVDISNPFNPVRVDSSLGTYGGFTVRGNYAYVGRGGGLRIVDISNSSNPTEIGFLDVEASIVDVAVSGKYVYVAATYDRLYVIDISNLANPTKVGYFNTGGRVSNISVYGKFIYATDYDDGLYILQNDLIERESYLPNKYKLVQNYPNPFNPTTTVEYELSEKSDITIVIYNTLGCQGPLYSPPQVQIIPHLKNVNTVLKNS